jgi:chromosome segregation ATPase
LTLKIRLLITSVDKAQEIGINWWESDPALSAQNRELRIQRDELSRRLDRVEAHIPGLEREEDEKWEWEPALSAQNRELRIQRDELQERLDRLEAKLAEREDDDDQERDEYGRFRSRSSKKDS